jgi:hypothetical protein
MRMERREPNAHSSLGGVGGAAGAASARVGVKHRLRAEEHSVFSGVPIPGGSILRNGADGR